MPEQEQTSRRDFLSRLAMWGGLILAYGSLGVQSALFILPERLRPRTRFLFIGQISEYDIGTVRTIRNLAGTPILVKCSSDGFTAYSSICPHLGCRVAWEAENNRFFCPCHRGVFDEKGVATSGPPADAGQSLAEVPLKVDEEAGVLYLEVREPKRRRA